MLAKKRGKGEVGEEEVVEGVAGLLKGELRGLEVGGVGGVGEEKYRVKFERPI